MPPKRRGFEIKGESSAMIQTAGQAFYLFLAKWQVACDFALMNSSSLLEPAPH